jgi:hypothetical protein
VNEEPGMGDAAQSRRDQEVPADVYAARITGDRETLAKVLRTFQLVVGCRHAHLEPNQDGTATMIVYATEARIRELRDAGYAVESGENVSALGRERQREVGTGDRFEGGRVPPRSRAVDHGHGQRGGTAQ